MAFMFNPLVFKTMIILETLIVSAGKSIQRLTRHTYPILIRLASKMQKTSKMDHVKQYVRLSNLTVGLLRKVLIYLLLVVEMRWLTHPFQVWYIKNYIPAGYSFPKIMLKYEKNESYINSLFWTFVLQEIRDL